jgi:uncharacterized protein
MERSNGNISDELKKLLLLQELDGKMFDVKSELEEMPSKISAIDDSLENKKLGMRQAEDELKELQVKKGQKEIEVGSKEDKVGKYEADLYGIKNNKEFLSLKQEIGSIKADISIIEDELLAIFDEIEAAQKKFDEEKSKFENEKTAAGAEKASMAELEKTLRSDLKALLEERASLSSNIAPDVLKQYQKILDKWGKTALAVIDGEFCGECNMQLRAQIIDESKLGRHIVLCENCSRILYAEN